MKEEVFISYAWAKSVDGKKSHEEIVGDIEKVLKKDFNVVIDKKDIKYKDNIKDFENRLGNGNKIVLIISDRFLKSKHCMYEVLKIKEKGNVNARIFPVVMYDSAIYDSHNAMDYIKHWENESSKLDKKLKTLKTQAYTTEVRKDLDNYSQFRAMFDDFRGLLSNMNTLNPDTHKETNFKELLNALKGNKPKENNKLEREFGNKISETKKLFESAIEIISKEIKEEGIKADEILEKIKYFHQQSINQTFQIAVMAMLKSGKSTFLNALLGDEFLPMSNVAETSVPVKIIHSENEKSLLVYGKNKIEGAQKIKSHIEATNKEKRKQGLKYEVEFNLHTSFEVLKNKRMTDIKFEILDTPGFGEAITEITVGKSIDQSNSELIDKISAIIYLLDYTKLKTTDENQVLEKLTEMRSDILDKISDRLFFVINKIDEEDRNSLPPDEAIDYVYDLVKKKMPKVLRQHFFVISANHALLSRLILKGNATVEAKQDFGKIAFGVRANKMDEAAYKEVAGEILHSSRITEIESNIINYIFENRSRIFIEGLQDNLKRLLQEFKNKFVVTAEGVLSRTVEEIDVLEAKIETAKKKQESIQDEADKFEKEIKEWIEGEFKNFERTIIDHIDSVFNFEKAQEKQSLLGRIAPNWVKRIHRALMDVEERLPHSSKEDIEQLVRDINFTINEELANSFAQFRTELESKLVNKQNLLFNNLKQTINTLAKDFEATLKKVLRVEFDNIDIRFEEPDFDRILSEADSLINKFVQTNLKWVNVKRKGQVYSHRANCFTGGYKTVTYLEKQMFAENKISKAILELFWKKIIDEKYANAKSMTNKLLENNIKSQIKNARNSFNSYVGDYTTTIQEQKLKLTSSSKEEIELRILNLRKLNKDISTIITAIE